MDAKQPLFLLLALSLLMLGGATAATVGHASIYAPAVVLGNNTGSLTEISLLVTTGNGLVSISGPTSVNTSTLDSAVTAADYASIYLQKNESQYDFNYTIADFNSSVSGPSAGAAMTMLALASFTGQPIASNLTMTGTISSDGTIGEVGGIYDKVSAAKRSGMAFVLVPSAAGDPTELKLYQLVQDTFSLPLVQVANVSQAEQYALSGRQPVEQQQIYNPYVDYRASGLIQAPLQCTNCDPSGFQSLVNYTLNFTSSSLSNLSRIPGFSGTAASLSLELNQSGQISSKGYQYTAADLAFLDYLDSYYFSKHTLTPGAALHTLETVQSECSTLTPPPLTRKNYEYVVGGELRQGWATQTITSAIASYNQSNLESDQILGYLSIAGNADAWCRAAGYMYGLATTTGGTQVVQSTALKSIAESRIRLASTFGPNLYLASAVQAYNQSDYPTAIIDADYASTFYNATALPNDTAALVATANATARNSTYGLWSTQFANEAEFYIQESALANSTTTRLGYAQQALSTSQLASALSDDTRLIYLGFQNSSVQTAPPMGGITQNASMSYQLYSELQSINGRLFDIFAVLVILVAVGASLLAFSVAMHMHNYNMRTESRGRGGRRNRAR